jgi:Mor family transcriptional regulator
MTIAADIRQEVVQDYCKGWSSIRVAKKYSITTTSVLRFVREAGEIVRQKRGPQKGFVNAYQLSIRKVQRDAELLQRYSRGEPIKALCQAFGISPQRLYQIIVRNKE